VRCRAHGGGQIRPGGVAAAVTARYLNSQRLRLASSDDGLQYRPAAVRARRVLVKLNVNGADVEVNDRFARARCCGRCGTCWGLRGTKYGCGIGYCAACTVLIDGRNTKSCQTPAARAVGTAVTTVEGASATTGPRLSMTRARTRHPGSPDSHPFGRSATCTASKTWGWAAAFADDGTVTHESIRGTWHAPDELPEYRGGRFDGCDRRASQPSVRAGR